MFLKKVLLESLFNKVSVQISGKETLTQVLSVDGSIFFAGLISSGNMI